MGYNIITYLNLLEVSKNKNIQGVLFKIVKQLWVPIKVVHTL